MRPFSALDDARLRVMADLGYSPTMAAKTLGRSVGTVSDRAKKLGIRLVDRRFKDVPPVATEACPGQTSDRVSRMLAEWRAAAPVELAPRSVKSRAAEQSWRDLRADWLLEPWRRNAAAVIEGLML